MSSAGYESLIEYRRAFLERILSEERLRADSPLAQTFGSLGSFDIGSLTVDDAIVSVDRGSLSLAMVPESNGVNVAFSEVGAQLLFNAPSAPAAVMYDMTAILTIEAAVSSAMSGDDVVVGLDTATVDVEAQVTSGHPLDDQVFLSEILESAVHDAFNSPGLPAGPQSFPNPPLFPFGADLTLEIENDLGPEAAPLRSLQVTSIGADRVNFLVPVELRWSSITPNAGVDPDDYEPSIAMRFLVQVPADVVRQLAVAPASVTLSIDPTEASAVLPDVYEGAATAARPDVAPGIDTTMALVANQIATQLASLVPAIDALTLAEINDTVAELVSDRLTSSGQVLPFWQREPDQDFSDATPRVLESSLIIAVNAGDDANPDDLESFIPDGEDFAAFLDGEAFIDTLDLWLHTPDTQSSLVGQCRVSGADQTGLELTIDGFGDDIATVFAETRLRIDGGSTFIVAEEATVTDGTATVVLNREIEVAPDDNAPIEFLSAFVTLDNQSGDTLIITGLVRDSGTIRAGTRFSIVGVDGEYRVSDDASIIAGGAVLQLDTDLASSPEAPARIAWITGFGIPGRRFDAGGNDREVRLDDLTPSLADGHIHLGGPITVLRPNALLFKEIGGSVGVDLRLLWADSVLANGHVDGSDMGTEISVHLIDKDTTIPAGTFVEVQGAVGVKTLAADAVVEDGQAVIQLDQPLGPFAGNFSTVRFVSATERDLDNELVDDPDVQLGADGIGQNLLDAVIGAVLGVFLTVFTGGAFGVLVFIISTFLREAIEAIAGKKAAGQLGSAVSAPVPDSLNDISVNIASRFNNPIVISPDGVLMAGSANAESVFRSLDDSQATTGGPYVATAGSSLALTGGLIADNTDYTWNAGDGADLAGRTPDHVYAQRGYRAARLTTISHQFGDDIEVRNRHLGLVRVRNSRPEITGLAPITGLEGHEVEVTATFSDMSWPDTHIAYVLFGDGTAPVYCEIEESNDAPLATGTATARHTYCDNGVFTVTVKIIDEHGGSVIETTSATIQNVDPTVDAGREFFAYPCVPTRLIGTFKDVGWCDTHTGLWNFGDCSPIAAATIEETNDPPAAMGTATATHCYETCGTYVAELTITDDDGGSATDHTVVRVVDLLNGHFDKGFAERRFGRVGNFWEPYVSGPSDSVLEGQKIFFCEECVVFDESRSQGIAQVSSGVDAAGIWQQVGANVGWDYQFSAFVHATTPAADMRIGIDPAGGTDPQAASVLWTSMTAAERWTPIAVRANAVAELVTVFVESRDQRASAVYIDAVELKVFPCAIEPPDTDDEIPPPGECLDIATVDPGPIVAGGLTTIEGIEFEPLDGSALRFATYHEPVGAFKLAVPEQGLRAIFAGPVEAVVATVASADGPVSVIAVDNTGMTVDAETGEAPPGEPHQIAVSADNIASIVISGGTRATLNEICFRSAVPNDGSGFFGVLPPGDDPGDDGGDECEYPTPSPRGCC